jgi:putative OPT family oligopeptide transporter
MAAPSFHLTTEPEPIHSPLPSPVTPAPRELTPRALLLGCAIGAVLAAGNVYTGLKTSFIDGGSITAALLGFTFFATFKRLARHSYTALENNITQTTAASAAIMGFVVGAMGPMPALHLMGNRYPWWGISLWGIALGLVGILVAASLRRKLIVTEALPFPTGSATAEVIETIYNARETALRRAHLLLLAALVALAFTWLRDGRPSVVPSMTALPITIAGFSAAALTLGVSWSPLMTATGVFMGLRNAASLLLGGLLAWAVLAPILLKAGIVRTATYGDMVGWLVWPGLGLMLASTVVPLLLDWRTVGRSIRDLPSMVRRRMDDRPDLSEPNAHLPFQRPLILAAVALLLWVGWFIFHLHPVITLLALLLSVIFAGICARAAGETDLAPIGTAGTLSQIVFAGYGATVSLISGSVASGDSSQTAQTLWALKAGHRLKASPRAQIIGQIIGAVLGGVVVVPVYLIIVASYGVGTEAMPAPSALSWKATAEAVRGGLSSLPPYAVTAGVVGLVAGVVFTLLGRTRFRQFVPSATALGIAVITPASLSVAAFLGALAVFTVRKLRPSISENSAAAVAAGGIAGESIMGIIIAALIAAGVL